MQLTDPNLENDELRLEPLAEKHREPLRATDAVEYMWQSMPVIQRGAGYDTYFDYMIRRSEAGDTIPFVIYCKADNRLIGVTAFVQPVRIHRRVMIGYTWIDAQFRGRGVFQAVQGLLIKRAIMWGARRIGWHIEGRNTRAVRAIEALGARYEGTLRNYARFTDGTWVDIVLLSMLRDEAKEAVLRLEQRRVDAAPNET